MNSNYIFTNQVSAGYSNFNIPPNYSWVQVENNAGRPLYAQASYITNLDGLTVALTASNVNIGDVHIADPITGLHADIAQIGVGLGALRVLSQDLTAVSDSVSIGDQFGNYAVITNSALNVFVNNLQSTTVTNWDVLSANINSSTYTTLPSNPANEITILNNTGGTMYIKNASKSIGLPIDNNTSVDLKLVGDTSEVAIKSSSNNKTVFATFISYN
jgi:hypothetical protein